MADDILKGLGDETLREAQLIKEATQDVGENISRWNRLLKDAGYSLVDQNRSINNIKNAADSVASIQEKAAKSAKATKEAFEKQAKLLSNVRELNQKINSLYEQALRPGEQNAKLLLRQAQHLEAARDNAQALANVFKDIGTSAAKLDKSTSFFSQMAAATSSLSKISTPFEKAAEAARKTALENAKNKASVKEMLTTGKGLTAEKAKELGLGEKLLDKNGKLLSGTALTNRLNKLGEVENLAAKGAKSVAGAGTKALLGEMFSMSNLLGKAGWIGLLIQAGKFIFDIFKGAQEQTVNIARNLSISTDSANAVRSYFDDIQNSAKETYVTIQNLIDAQAELTNQLQRAGTASESTLLAQTALTKRFQMSGEAAAVITARSEQTGEAAEQVLRTTLDQNKADVFRGKSMIGQRQLLDRMSKTSAEIFGYFKNSNNALAEGVKKTHLYGLNLNQALNVAKSLLDFESSISTELDLETLTGVDLNLERARAFAVTGDIADAAAEAMNQLGKIPENLRKNPFVIEDMAKQVGLSAEELQQAFLAQKDITRQQKFLADIIKTKGKEEAEAYARKLGFDLASYDQAKQQVTLDEQWAEALEKMKSQVMGLVDSGAIDTLTDAIARFAEVVGGFTGANERQSQAAAKAIVEGKNYSQEQKSKAAALQEAAKKEGQYKGALTATATGAAIGTVIAPGIGTAIGAGLGFIAGATADYFADEEGTQARKDLLEMRDNPGAKVKDFVIQTHPEDTLALVGGTKISDNKTVEETNSLLRQLIAAVKEGKPGDIYIGPHKLNEAIGLNLHSIS